MSIVHRPCRVAIWLAIVTAHHQPIAAVAQTLSDPSLTLTPVVTTGLTLPTTMAFVAPNDFLVLQKNNGQVRRVLNGVLQPTIALDVNVNSDSERGLLGIAVNTETPPRVFLYYTEATGADGGAVIANRVYRYTWNAGTGTLQSPALILDLPVTPGPNHDGGVLVLGPPGEGTVGDGSLLYVVIGDLNRNGQMQNNAGGAAADDTGVILRVEQDGSPAPGNPFTPYCSVTTSQTCPTGSGCPGGETCRTAVARYYAYGVRNSFGLTLDPVTGDLWDTENGPGDYDEVNRIAAGVNSGWNRIMGPDSRDAQGVGDLFHMPGAGITYSDPEFSWLATVAPTGIVFPNGSTLGAAYDAVALVGDSNNGNLYRFPLNGARTAFDLAAFSGLSDLVADSTTERNLVRIGQGFGGITDLKIGPDGHLYIVSIGLGDVYRVSGGPTPTPTNTVASPTQTFTATPTNTSPPPPPTSTPTASATSTVTATASNTVPTATVTPTNTPPAPPACAATPEVCRTPVVAAKALLVLKDNANDDGKDLLLWKWLKGASTDKLEFGNPVTTQGYELCIYDSTGLVANASIPAGSAWRETGSGFKYRDASGAAEGIQTIILKAGADQKAKIIVRGKGAGLDMPNLGLLTSPLTVQLKRAGSPTCWGAVYSFPPALKNTAAMFKDKGD